MIELVCNGSPSHDVFPDVAAADAARARDVARVEALVAGVPEPQRDAERQRLRRYPDRLVARRGGPPIDVPYVWTTREVDAEYAARFLAPFGPDATSTDAP
jgi:hypothetical protein